MSIGVSALATVRTSFSESTNFALAYCWIILGVLTTAYSFYWDVVFDWGLGNWNTKYLLLRDQMYFAPGMYYTAIVCDLFMRLGWAFVISPGQPYLEQHYILLLGAIELFRRFLWSIIRIEWDQIKINTKSAGQRVKVFKMRKINHSAERHMTIYATE
jgi:hypothetical protein